MNNEEKILALLDWAEVCSETYSLPLPKIGQ